MNNNLNENTLNNEKNPFYFVVNDNLKKLYKNHYINLPNISNMRDLGGYETIDGRKIKKNLLIRSGSLHNITNEEIDVLENKYKIKTILDLRATYEINLHKDKTIKNSKYFNICVVEMNETQEFLMKNFQIMMNDSSGNILNTYKKIEKLFSNSNVDLIENKYTQKQYYETIKKIIESDGAVLFHCTSGKDRTGILAMFILSILGVDKEIIIDDYEASNVYFESFCNNAQNQLLEKGLSPCDVKNIITIIGVNRDAIENDFDIIEKKYGGMNNYLKNQIGLSDEDLKLLKEKYIE